MRVDALADALAAVRRAVFLQPRAHNPTGITLTARRGKQLADVLAKSDAIVVEDDHSGDIASGALVSMGTHLPGRTVHIRSYSKSHGPDLRLAAVGGAGHVVSAVANRRLLGPGWSSRILQAVLLEMLDHDPTVRGRGRGPRRVRRAPRRGHRRARRRRASGFTGTDGINLWMQVADERSSLITLAAQGIGAAPGEPFMVRPDVPSLRVTVGLIDHDIEAIAKVPRRRRRHGPHPCRPTLTASQAGRRRRRRASNSRPSAIGTSAHCSIICSSAPVVGSEPTADGRGRTVVGGAVGAARVHPTPARERWLRTPTRRSWRRS